MSAPDQASPVSCSTALQGLHQQQSKARKKKEKIYIVVQTRKIEVIEAVGSLYKNKAHFLSNTRNLTNRLQAKEV